jgi:hypothetical protein
MDSMSVLGSLLSMRADQTQQTISVAIVKQAAAQQDMVATMLAQNVQQPVPSGSTFSIYA